MNLFAYGTLMWPEVMEALLGRRPEGIPAVLAGYRRLRLKAKHYPVMVAASGAAVEGTLYTGLSEKDFEVLDAFEGEEYDRETVSLGSGFAQAYILAPRWRHLADSVPWRPEQFKPEHFADLGLDVPIKIDASR